MLYLIMYDLDFCVFGTNSADTLLFKMFELCGHLSNPSVLSPFFQFVISHLLNFFRKRSGRFQHPCSHGLFTLSEAIYLFLLLRPKGWAQVRRDRERKHFGEKMCL